VRTLAEDAEGTLVSGNGQVSRDKAEIQDWTMISDQNLSKLFKIMRNLSHEENDQDSKKTLRAKAEQLRNVSVWTIFIPLQRVGKPTPLYSSHSIKRCRSKQANPWGQCRSWMGTSQNWAPQFGPSRMEH
jgi:hypothetical protein